MGRLIHEKTFCNIFLVNIIRTVDRKHLCSCDKSHSPFGMIYECWLLMCAGKMAELVSKLVLNKTRIAIESE